MTMPKGLVETDQGPVAKVKKIQEKNAAKGQNSLAKFFGPMCGSEGVKSNRAAFEHYAIASNSYSEKMISQSPVNPEEQPTVAEKPDKEKKRDVK